MVAGLHRPQCHFHRRPYHRRRHRHRRMKETLSPTWFAQHPLCRLFGGEMKFGSLSGAVI